MKNMWKMLYILINIGFLVILGLTYRVGFPFFEISLASLLFVSIALGREVFWKEKF